MKTKAETPETPAISKAEWKVMKVLWDKSPQPAYDIIQTLAKTEPWQGNTVKTVLNRLYRKKVLGIRRYKNLYLYYPLVSEEECLQKESESFLLRFFDGSARSMALYFARRDKLTLEDIAELRKALDQN